MKPHKIKTFSSSGCLHETPKFRFSGSHFCGQTAILWSCTLRCLWLKPKVWLQKQKAKFFFLIQKVWFCCIVFVFLQSSSHDLLSAFKSETSKSKTWSEVCAHVTCFYADGWGRIRNIQPSSWTWKLVSRFGEQDPVTRLLLVEIDKNSNQIKTTQKCNSGSNLPDFRIKGLGRTNKHTTMFNVSQEETLLKECRISLWFFYNLSKYTWSYLCYSVIHQ